MRSTAGATMPTALYGGHTATIRAAAAIIEMVRVMPALRPRRSAKAPSTAAPIGRITNPTANTARVARRSAVLSPLGKNWVEKIGANAE